MLPLIQAVNDTIERYISQFAKSEDAFELKDTMGKFSMDALASCAFGVDSGSFTDKNSEFVKHAQKLFEFGDPIVITRSIMALFTPTKVKQFFAKLGFVSLFAWPNLQHSKFFIQVVEATIKQRIESKTKRNDLIDMMMDALEGRLDVTEENDHANDQYEQDAKLIGHSKKTKDLDYEHVISTAMILLIAGYDSTGTTMSYILYELAINQDYQDILFEEIENAKKGGSKLSYETIQSLPYLDAVIHETLRRHPVIAALERPCTKDYKMPNTNLAIKKGDLIRVNNIGICFDPDIFPNPEEWNPDNFSKESRAGRNPYSFMAFSLGPRNCLAMRFALFEMKVCISDLVSKFRFVPCEKTCKNVQWDPKLILGGAKGGLWIKCENR